VADLQSTAADQDFRQMMEGPDTRWTRAFVTDNFGTGFPDGENRNSPFLKLVAGASQKDHRFLDGWK